MVSTKLGFKRNFICKIGIKMPDRKILSIDCYSCGDPYNVGILLKSNYSTKIKVLELISYGDIRELVKAGDHTHYGDYGVDWEKCKPKTYDNFECFLSGDGFDFSYIFDDDGYRLKWKCYDGKGKELVWYSLKKEGEEVDGEWFEDRQADDREFLYNPKKRG